jgi:tryptophan halogenase
MLGQRLEPRRYHPLARIMPPDQLGGALADLRAGIAAQVARLPAHQTFVDRYCPST